MIIGLGQHEVVGHDGHILCAHAFNFRSNYVYLPPKGAINEQSRFYGAVRLGLREVGRTSLLKSGSQLILEEPGKTFHVAIEEAYLLEKSSTISDFNQSRVEKVADAVSDEQSGAGTKTSKISSGILRSDLVDTVEVEDEDFHDSTTSCADLSCTPDKHEQEPLFSPLKIELWNQNDNHEGHQQLLGTATVPIWGTRYPVGDLRLSLKDSVLLDKTSGSRLNDKGIIEYVGRESKNELSGVIETFPAREIGNEDTSTTAQGGDLIKKLCGLQPKEQRTHGEHGSDTTVIGFVHLWLGQASKTGAISRQPGDRRMIFKVHAASGLPENLPEKVIMKTVHYLRHAQNTAQTMKNVQRILVQALSVNLVQRMGWTENNFIRSH